MHFVWFSGAFSAAGSRRWRRGVVIPSSKQLPIFWTLRLLRGALGAEPAPSWHAEMDGRATKLRLGRGLPHAGCGETRRVLLRNEQFAQWTHRFIAMCGLAHFEDSNGPVMQFEVKLVRGNDLRERAFAPLSAD